MLKRSLRLFNPQVSMPLVKIEFQTVRKKENQMPPAAKPEKPPVVEDVHPRKDTRDWGGGILLV